MWVFSWAVRLLPVFIVMLLVACDGSNKDSTTDTSNTDVEQDELPGSTSTETSTSTGTQTDVECTTQTDTATDTTTQTDTQINDPQAMQIGDELIIELESNATAGFEWDIQKPTDEAVIALISSEYIGPDKTQPPGSPGTQVFVFSAMGVGTTTVLIYYWQHWDTAAPLEEYSLDVTVVK